MANKITNTQYYSAIANAIREKNGEQTTYRPSEMAAAITAIPTGGGGTTLTETYRAYWFENGTNLHAEQLWELISLTHATDCNGTQNMFEKAIRSSQDDAYFQSKNFKIDYLGAYMFKDCYNLTDFDIDDENFYYHYHNWSQPFVNCYLLPAGKVLSLLEEMSAVNRFDRYNSNGEVANVGTNLATPEILGNYTFGARITPSSNFLSNNNIKKIGNLTFNCSGSRSSYGTMLDFTSNTEEVGMITFTNCYVNFTYSSALIISGSSIKKFGGLSVPNQGSRTMNNTNKLFDFGTDSAMEECLNIPASHLMKGFGDVQLNTQGTSSNPAPLHRLTCNTTNTAYVNKTNAKSFSIKYCSFNRDEMVELFNSLPDASNVTGAKNITITGNPCVTDGTLTAADMAIATNKGYTLTT